MGAVLLAVVYLATSLALAAAVRLWPAGRRSLRPSIGAVLLLTLLPLAFTAGGFWRQKVLAPMQDGVINLCRVKLRDQQRLASGPL